VVSRVADLERYASCYNIINIMLVQHMAPCLPVSKWQNRWSWFLTEKLPSTTSSPYTLCDKDMRVSS